MDSTTAGGWGDVLLKGANALIDSQSQKAYVSNLAAYNTQAGLAGQAQAGTTTLPASPVVLIGGLLLVGLVIFLAVRR